MGEGSVIAPESKTKLAPAETRAAGSDSTILNMAANCAGSDTPQTVSSLFNDGGNSACERRENDGRSLSRTKKECVLKRAAANSQAYGHHCGNFNGFET